MKTLHLFDISGYVYAGDRKKEYATRGVRESDAGYTPNRAPIGGCTYIADKLSQVLNSGEDMVICFDRYPKIKHDMYFGTFGWDGYKAKRGKNTDIFKQKDFAERLLNAANILCVACDEYEADDLIYSYWKDYYDEYDNIRIHTHDRDLAFMVDEKTAILPVASNGVTIDMSTYSITTNQKMMVPYNMVLFTKLMYGDTSDNIPGIGGDWLRPIVAQMKEMDTKPEDYGKVNLCRELIIELVGKCPDLPNAANALNTFNLVTPLYLNTDRFGRPNCDGDIGILRSIARMRTKPEGYSLVEDMLCEYITEFNR